MQMACSGRTLRWIALLALLFCVTLCGASIVTAEDAVLRLPEPSGNKDMTYSKNGFEVDYGNSAEGYILVKCKPTEKKIKVRVSFGETTLTYDLNGKGEYDVFPLQLGDGKYKIQFFQQVKGTQYSPGASTSITVALSDPNICFLYPNQYANYNADTQAVALGKEICAGLTTDKEKAEAVFKYLSTNLAYHFIRAVSVEKGYLPDLDSVLKEKMGICFDYSALMACMLRTQGVPTQVVIGFADQTYHAWNKVLINGEWVRMDATFEATKAKVKSYTEERFY